MNNMLNEVSLNETMLGENGLPVDTLVLDEKNLARTKGLLIGATIVGAGWLATSLYKKFKKRKDEESEKEFEAQGDVIE